jgi:PAS domain S-box-containing protein
MKAAPAPTKPRPSHPFPRLGLRFVLLLMLATVLTGIIGAYVFLSFRYEIRQDTHKTLAAIAEQKRQHLEQWLARNRIDAKSYLSGNAQIPMLLSQYLEGGGADETLLSRMRARMEEVRWTLGLSGMAILDRAGRPLMVVGEVEPQGQAALIQEFWRQPRIEFVDLHRNAAGEVELGELAPISARGAAPLGLAYLAWRADQALYPLIASWPVPTETAETYLVRSDGDRIRFLTPLRHQPDAPLAMTETLTAAKLAAVRAAQGQRGILTDARDYRNIPSLAYATAITGTPWLMIAKIDEREAYAGIRITAWVTGFVAGLALLLIHGSGYLLWRQATARLASERRLGALIEQGLTGYAEANLEGYLTRVNDRYCQIVGQTREALLGRPLRDFTPPEDWTLNRALFDRLLSGEVASGILEKRYQRQDGGWTHAQVAVALARDRADHPAGFIALVADLTERKRAEATLMERSALLASTCAEQRAIYDAATVGIALASNRVILRCNRTMERLFGYGEGGLIGQSARLLYPDEATFTEFGQRFTAGLRREGAYREEIEMVRQDGRRGVDARLDGAHRPDRLDKRARRHLRGHHRRAGGHRALPGTQRRTGTQGRGPHRRGRRRQPGPASRQPRTEAARHHGRPHRGLEPTAIRTGRGAPDRPGTPLRRSPVPVAVRHRSLQGNQRSPWPSGGRPGAGRVDPPGSAPPSGRRPADALGRRRIHGHDVAL